MNWYKRAQSNISISLERYRSTLWEELYKLAVSSEKRNERIMNLSYEKGELENLLSSINYPQKIEILNNPDSAEQHITKLFNWYLAIPYEQKTKELRSVLIRIQDILENIQMKGNNSYSRGFSMDDARKTLEEFYSITLENMKKIKEIIESKLQKIRSWNNSPILIEAIEYDRDNDIGPEDSARVYLVGENGPMFSLFMTNGTYEIDDIMDGSEDIEEFLGQKTKLDYFSLINVLQNKSENLKNLTLYTARPVRDRNFYQEKQTLPANVYLTNNFNRASGIALELKGEEKYRDIWRVKVSPYDVVVSYDGGTFKDYMTINEVHPESIKLISPGE
jgi:hypothetical protein